MIFFYKTYNDHNPLVHFNTYISNIKYTHCMLFKICATPHPFNLKLCISSANCKKEEKNENIGYKKVSQRCRCGLLLILAEVGINKKIRNLKKYTAELCDRNVVTPTFRPYSARWPPLSYVNKHSLVNSSIKCR